MKIYIVSPIKDTINKTEREILLLRLSDLFDRLFKAKMLQKDGDQFDLSNIKIIGINGHNYDKSLDKYLHDNWEKSYLRNFSGTRGCALSHIEILKDIEKNSIDEDILILEDDALINPNFLDLIPKQFPEDYDIFVMYTPYQSNYDLQTFSWSENIRKIEGNIVDTMGAYTYFVNGRHVKKILKHLLPLQWQIDFSLTGGTNPNINTYLLNPELEASGDSKISYRKMLNQKNIKYVFKIKQSPPFLLKKEQELDLIVHNSMINDVAREDMFNFYIEDEDHNFILINTFIEIIFPDIFYANNNELDVVKFKFKNNKIIEKNKKYKLHILYTHPEGLHGIDTKTRNLIYKEKNNPHFSQHKTYPNSSQDFILTIDIVFTE